MGRLATVLCAITGIMTIIDHFTSTPFFSVLLSRHVTSTPSGYQISPSLNFLVTISLGAIFWMSTGADAPAADPAAAKRQTWKRINLAAAAMAAWLLLGPAIRRDPAVDPQLQPALPPASAAVPAGTTPAAAPAVATPPATAPTSTPFGLKPLYRQSLGHGR